MKHSRHGSCTVCKGPITEGITWTFTGMMNRVHSDPDDCISVLHPKLHAKFMKLNLGYMSVHRYATMKDDI
jgi:hypothetical protein